MNQISRFKTPTPTPWLMKCLGPINTILCLKGIPLLRDVPLLNRLPGVSGLAKVRHIDFPETQVNRLREVCGKNKATFFLPNHPEFFTDWMIDKFILSKVSPLAASWASGEVVNGMGKWMQDFWLNNNLVAQVPGNSDKGKAYSIKSALSGNGVLLHPEGQVGWHSRHIAPLFSGAAKMAIASYKKGIQVNNSFQSWLAPIIWKLRFNQDVEHQLLKECQYIENRLAIDISGKTCPATRVYDIYLTLAKRDYYQHIDSNDSFSDMHLYALKEKIIQKASRQLGAMLDCPTQNPQLLMLEAKNWMMSHHAENASYQQVKDLKQTIKRWLRLKTHLFEHDEISQEDIAEHLKRIRSDFCKGTLRDSINQYMPQAAAPRTVHVRAVEPFSVNAWMNTSNPDPVKLMQEIRISMQQRLDALQQEIELSFPGIKTLNPFYYSVNKPIHCESLIAV